MMIIDFHTHCFPDKIAPSVVQKFRNTGRFKDSTNGTKNGLIKSMKAAGIDYSVILPAQTSPKQFESINKYACEINGKDGIFSFGGIHPENDEIETKLDYIKSLGLRGIKLHPDYQGTFIDDEKYINIISYAVSIGLYVVTHAGLDGAYPDLVHCTPERVVNMLERVYEGMNTDEPRIILAHLGSIDETDKVIEMLAGRNLYLDTAYMLDILPEEKIIEVMRKHGADKILFGTDCPWAFQDRFVDIIKNLNITDEEKEMIMYKNALKILNIDSSFKINP